MVEGMNQFDFYKSATRRSDTASLGKGQEIISGILHSEHGDYLWVASPKMIQKFSPAENKTKNYPIPSINPNNRIRHLVEMADNKVLVASGQGLFMIDANNNSVKEIIAGSTAGVNNKGYYTLAKDGAGNIGRVETMGLLYGIMPACNRPLIFLLSLKMLLKRIRS